MKVDKDNPKDSKKYELKLDLILRWFAEPSAIQERSISYTKRQQVAKIVLHLPLLVLLLLLLLTCC